MSGNKVKLNSGHSMPLVSLGTFRIRGEDIYNVLDASLKAGYRSIDTAAVYRNEKSIAEALKILLPKYSLTNKDIFITSKLGPKGHQPEKCLECCKNSLDNLGGDYIDMHLIHWPGTQGLKPENETNAENRKNSWKIMEKLHRKGQLKSIGVSNYTLRHMEELMSYCEVKPAILQIEHHPHLIQRDLVDFCRENDIQFQAYSSLGTSAADNKLLKDPVVSKLAQKYEKRAAQILLRWAVQQNISVIPKSTSPVHIEENIDIFNFNISEADMEELNSLDKNYHYCWNPEKIT